MTNHWWADHLSPVFRILVVLGISFFLVIKLFWSWFSWALVFSRFSFIQSIDRWITRVFCANAGLAHCFVLYIADLKSDNWLIWKVGLMQWRRKEGVEVARRAWERWIDCGDSNALQLRFPGNTCVLISEFTKVDCKCSISSSFFEHSRVEVGISSHLLTLLLSFKGTECIFCFCLGCIQANRILKLISSRLRLFGDMGSNIDGLTSRKGYATLEDNDLGLQEDPDNKRLAIAIKQVTKCFLKFKVSLSLFFFLGSMKYAYIVFFLMVLFALKEKTEKIY